MQSITHLFIALAFCMALEDKKKDAVEEVAKVKLEEAEVAGTQDKLAEGTLQEVNAEQSCMRPNPNIAPGNQFTAQCPFRGTPQCTCRGAAQPVSLPQQQVFQDGQPMQGGNMGQGMPYGMGQGTGQDMGQGGQYQGQQDMGQGIGQSDMGQGAGQPDMGQGAGQQDLGQGMGQGDMSQDQSMGQQTMGQGSTIGTGAPCAQPGNSQVFALYMSSNQAVPVNVPFGGMGGFGGGMPFFNGYSNNYQFPYFGQGNGPYFC